MTVTPGTAVRTVFVLLLTILSLVVIIWIVTVWSGDEIYAIGYRSYQDAPLSRVVEDLEDSGLIPKGTTWSEAALRGVPVTVKWLAPTRSEALDAVASAAHVQITYTALQHGEPRCPLHIAWPDSHGQGVSPDRYHNPYMEGPECPQPHAPHNYAMQLTGRPDTHLAASAPPHISPKGDAQGARPSRPAADRGR